MLIKTVRTSISSLHRHSCTYSLGYTFSFMSVETSSFSHKHSGKSAQQLNNFPHLSFPTKQTRGVIQYHRW